MSDPKRLDRLEKTAKALDQRIGTLEVLLQDILLRLPIAGAEPTPAARAGSETRKGAPPAAPRAAGGRYLVCVLAGRLLGVPLERVAEVVRMPALRPVPRPSPVLDGMLDLRGTPVEVIELRVALGVERLPDDLDARIVLVECGGRKYGFKVDDVQGVQAVPPADVQPAPAMAGAEFVTGLYRSDDGLTLLVDPDVLVEVLREAGALETLEAVAALGAADDGPETEAAE